MCIYGLLVGLLRASTFGIRDEWRAHITVVVRHPLVSWGNGPLHNGHFSESMEVEKEADVVGPRGLLQEK